MDNRVAIVYSKHYQINMAGLERLHPHPQRYASIYLKLQTDGLIRPEDVFVPTPVTREEILRVHTEEFLLSLSDSARVAQYLELPIVRWSPSALIDAGILAAFRSATGGTVEAARLAMKYGIAINLAGGYHHAKPDAGEGFCIYNDLAIAIRAGQAEGLFRRALVVDLDVHQGNGTAICFEGDDEVFTFSMHEDDIYPIPKETSDLDIELQSGAGDRTYLMLLSMSLPKAMEEARPEIVFLQGGADVLYGDPLARLKMTADGLVRRDSMVIDECVQRSIPVVMTLGGGYGENAWKAQAASIARTIETYGLQSGRERYPQRAPSVKERLYTK